LGQRLPARAGDLVKRADMAEVCSPIWSELSEPPVTVAREPAGTPSRYLPVSTPWASGENAMQPIPSRSSTSSRPPSIQRFSIEYDGW
jgi:hypothetical protein